MANRTFQTQMLGLIKRHVQIYGIFSVGVAGAVTMLKRTYPNGVVTYVTAPTTGTGYSIGNGEGIRSVTRTGTGAWTVTLSDAYMYLLETALVSTTNTSGLLTAAAVGCTSSDADVQTNHGQGYGGLVKVQFNDWAGAAVDPASGDVVDLRFTFGDGSES